MCDYPVIAAGQIADGVKYLTAGSGSVAVGILNAQNLPVRIVVAEPIGALDDVVGADLARIVRERLSESPSGIVVIPFNTYADQDITGKYELRISPRRNVYGGLEYSAMTVVVRAKADMPERDPSAICAQGKMTLRIGPELDQQIEFEAWFATTGDGDGPPSNGPLPSSSTTIYQSRRCGATPQPAGEVTNGAAVGNILGFASPIPAGCDGKSKGGSTRYKEPSELAFAAYRLHRLTELTQDEIAEVLTKEFKRRVCQGRVSRLIGEVRDYLAQGNVLPDVPKASVTAGTKATISVDPSEIDLGQRQDHLTPRQRPSSEQD